MHTFQAKTGALFHFNSDLSGEVIVASRVGEEARVPFAALAEFVDTHRKMRGGRRGEPDPARAKALEEAKANVVQRLSSIDGCSSEHEKWLIEQAVKAVKGAR